MNESEIVEDQEYRGVQSDGYRFSSGEVDQKKLNDGGNIAIINGQDIQEPESHDKVSDAGDKRVTRASKVSQ